VIRGYLDYRIASTQIIELIQYIAKLIKERNILQLIQSVNLQDIVIQRIIIFLKMIY